MPSGHYDRSKRTIPAEVRFWNKVNKNSGRFCEENKTECWLWTGKPHKRGYATISLPNGTSHGDYKLAHRFSYELHNGEIPDSLIVCHSCEDRINIHDATHKLCVNPQHLRLGTYEENALDRVKSGRANSVRGEAQGASKLTEAEVKDIREKYNTGNYSYKQLAVEYGVTKMPIASIIKRKSWTHI